MNHEQEPSFRDLLALIKRGAIPTIILAVLAAVATYFLSNQLDPVYRATSVIVAAEAGSNDNRFNVSLATATPFSVSAYAEAATSTPVLADALRTSNQADGVLIEPSLADTLALRGQVSISTEEDRNSSLIRISVEHVSPERAAAKANALALALVAWDKSRATDDLETIINTLSSQIAALDTEIQQERTQLAADATDDELIDATAIPESLASKLTLRGQQAQQLTYAQTLRTSAIGLLKVLEPAYTPPGPISPNPTRNAALAFILTALLSYGLLLLRDSLNIRFKDADEVAKQTGLAVLAEFPKLPSGARRLPLEASSYLRTNLGFALPANKTRTIVVTSALSSEGKSSVALSLAESFARNDFKTLLIDADLRKPVLASEYRLSGDTYDAVSLERHLLSDEPLKIPRISVNQAFSLSMIPTFEAARNPGQVLGNMREKLEFWREKFEVIIIDSAPVLPVADTLSIAPLCDGTLFVSGVAETDKRSVKKALDLLHRLNINVLGVAVTQMSKQNQKDSKYGYGYGYGYGEKETIRKAALTE